MRLESTNLKEEIYNHLWQMFKTDQKMKNRAICLYILMRHETIRTKICK